MTVILGEAPDNHGNLLKHNFPSMKQPSALKDGWFFLPAVMCTEQQNGGYPR